MLNQNNQTMTLDDLETQRKIRERNTKLDNVYLIINRIETCLAKLTYYYSTNFSEIDDNAKEISFCICKMSAFLRELYILSGSNPSLYRC